jgi:hypothetical protein
MADSILITFLVLVIRVRFKPALLRLLKLAANRRRELLRL